MLEVGSLGARWVLMQHAEPWLLTINGKQWSQSRFTSCKLPFLDSQHNIPFMRKRCRRGVHEETEEPPAKKSTVECEGGEDVEGLSSGITGEETNEEERLEKQKETADEGSGDTLVKLEEEKGKQMQAEEEEQVEAEQEKVETEKRPERMKLRARRDSIDDEECAPPGPADE